MNDVSKRLEQMRGRHNRISRVILGFVVTIWVTILVGTVAAGYAVIAHPDLIGSWLGTAVHAFKVAAR